MFDIDKVYTSNSCGDFIITEYKSSRVVSILFINTNYRMTTTAQNIRKGLVADRSFPVYYGVGFMGDGKYNSRLNKSRYKGYYLWLSILSRCYGSKAGKSNISYVGCTVCEEWHNFQNFAEWFEINYIDGFEIDKDILCQGNKVYSPRYCIFVHQSINKLFQVRTPSRVGLLRGVRKLKKVDRFDSSCYHDGKSFYLGSYITEVEAHEAYKDFKYKIIQKAASEQPEPIRSALMSIVIA